MGFAITLFTVEEANALVKELRPLLERLAALKAEVGRLQLRCEVLRLTVSAGGSEAGPEALELRQTQALRAARAGEIARSVEAIQAKGCLLKDLETGLLDFYALRGDRLVFLCWRRDEPEVGHWHSLEAGFAGREPLDAGERE